MATLVQRSPGTNIENTGTTIADTTNSTIPAGDKVFALITWFGNVTCNSVAGGGLTWTVRAATAAGAVIHTAIATADAPSGVASSTAITATFSATCFARSIIINSTDGLVLEATGPDTTGTQVSGSAASWSVGLTTTAAITHIVGYGLCDGGGAVTAIAPSGAGVTETSDWSGTLSGTQMESVYLNATSSGSNTVGGTWSGSQTRCASAVAYALAPTGFIPPNPTAADALAGFRRGRRRH